MNWLCSGAAVETKQSTQPLDAFDCAEGRSRTIIALDQSVVEPLVIPLRVVMSGEISGRLLERPFPEEDQSVETLVFDRPDKSFGVGIGLGRRMHPIQTLSSDVSE